MTPKRFAAAVAAYHDGQERQTRLVAWQTATILNMFVDPKQPPITVDDLLGTTTRRRRTVKSIRDEQAAIQEMFADVQWKDDPPCPPEPPSIA